MRNDPHVRISVSLTNAWQHTRDCLRRHGKALGAAWLMTNLIGALAFLVLYPPWSSVETTEGIGSFRYTIYFILYNIVSAVGFIFMVKVSQSFLAGEPREDYGTVLDESVRAMMRYFATAFLSLFRVMLWAMAGLPVAFALVYGAVLITGRTEPGPMVGLLATIPVMVMTVLAYVRFGWALYFTVLNGDTPLYAMYYSQSMYLNNRKTVLTMAAVVFVLPVVLPLIGIFGLVDVPGVEYVIPFVASAWTYLAGVFTVAVIMHAAPEGQAAIDEGDATSSHENS